MGWPKHKWGFIVLGGQAGQPLRDNGIGIFVESPFAEVFLDRKVAEWLRRDMRKRFASYAKDYEAEGDGAKQRYWISCYKQIRIIRIALPGTYAQAQIPESLERQLRKSLRNYSPARKESHGRKIPSTFVRE